MVAVRLAAIVWALGLPLLAQVEEYRARRAALRKALPEGVAVLFGRDAAGEGPFVQEPNFFYLTGRDEPGAVLLLSPAGEILFLPKPDERTLTYEGPRLTAEDPNAAALTGFGSVMPKTVLESELRKALDAQPSIYTLTGQAAADALKAMFPLREVRDARGQIARLRAKKSPREIELLQRSVDVTVEAQRAAWKRIAPGRHEYEVAASLVGAFLEKGCQRPAYPPIIGSGPNAIILHYEKNSRPMEPGELLLMDAGASCAGYAADITRTVPVSGKFSPRQREIYEVVLGALKAAVAAAKPGVPIGTRETAGSLNHAVYEYINSHGKDQAGNPLGKYLLHPIAHRVGLDVHDVYRETLALPLQPGDVLAVEPGVYIKDENIGIRIEEMIVVTDNGARVMSARLPREPGEIEKAIAGK